MCPTLDHVGLQCKTGCPVLLTSSRTLGIPIKSTMDNPTTTQYANLMHSFILKARSTVREIDPQNDLTFLRIRSKKNEIMVAPDKDYFLIVVQNPTE
ncbi:dynein light chain roadblock-type 1 isoform X3 [Echinops telfairi]|uniref:Dynein light chain roadblock-type 1 isoform X3 n=1 Tax=Echinops telfairi TaxID=9371 RepID=A0AC55DIF4_ECHTE|nr:dynein light chain roadblock-type 1 isoform X3 [Echinops telfairi]